MVQFWQRGPPSIARISAAVAAHGGTVQVQSSSLSLSASL